MIDPDHVDIHKLQTIIASMDEYAKREAVVAALSGDIAEFGSIIGTTLAGGSGELGDSFKSALFSSVGGHLGRYLGAGLDTDHMITAIGEGVDTLVANFDQTIYNSAISAASGFISTMLAEELAFAIYVNEEYEYDYSGPRYNGAPYVDRSFSATGGDDIFVGGSGDDTLRGRGGFDWLVGGAGDDVIYGGDQDDVLLGGEGSDLIYGGNGDDYIALGSGHDYTIWGPVRINYGARGGNG